MPSFQETLANDYTNHVSPATGVPGLSLLVFMLLSPKATMYQLLNMVAGNHNLNQYT